MVSEGPIFTFIVSFPTECQSWLPHASVPTSDTAVVKQNHAAKEVLEAYQAPVLTLKHSPACYSTF